MIEELNKIKQELEKLANKAYQEDQYNDEVVKHIETALKNVRYALIELKN